MPDPADAGFTRYFLAAVFFRSLLGGVLMAFGIGGVALGNLTSWNWAPFLAGCLGIGIGVVVAGAMKRRWDPLNRAPEVVPPTFPIDPRT